MTTTPVEYLESRGTRLRYSVEGAGPPLLLTSGIGASLELAQPLREALIGRSTIAWDAPGAGASDVPRRRPSLRLVADYAVAVLDELGLEQVDVMGISWGGLVSQELARRHPSRVRRLIVAATGTGWMSLPGDIRVLPILVNTRRYTSPRFLEEIGPKLYGGDVRRDPAILRRQARFGSSIHRRQRATGGSSWPPPAGRASTGSVGCRTGRWCSPPTTIPSHISPTAA